MDEETGQDTGAGDSKRSPAKGSPEDFFRANYRRLVRRVGYLGATEQESHDAACSALEDIVRNWTEINNPMAYARRAVVSEFLQTRERERRRLRRLIEGGNWTESAADAQLSAWEGREWVMQHVRTLPPRQREAMACLIDGLSSAEAAEVLGQTPDAVRQNWVSARARLKAALAAEGLRLPTPRTRATRKEVL